MLGFVGNCEVFWEEALTGNVAEVWEVCREGAGLESEISQMIPELLFPPLEFKNSR